MVLFGAYWMTRGKHPMSVTGTTESSSRKNASRELWGTQCLKPCPTWVAVSAKDTPVLSLSSLHKEAALVTWPGRCPMAQNSGALTCPDPHKKPTQWVWGAAEFWRRGSKGNRRNTGWTTLLPAIGRCWYINIYYILISIRTCVNLWDIQRGDALNVLNGALESTRQSGHIRPTRHRPRGWHWSYGARPL